MISQKTEVISTSTGAPAQRKNLNGYLKKQSPSMLHKWQKRYFVLLPDNRTVAYYKEIEDAKDVHLRKGTINIPDIKAVEFREGTEFHLVCSDRTYNLRANDVFEKKLWVNTIRAIREALIDAYDCNYDQDKTSKHVDEAFHKTMKHHHEHHNHHHGKHATHEGLAQVANSIVEEKTLTSHNGVITETDTLTMHKGPTPVDGKALHTEIHREGASELSTEDHYVEDYSKPLQSYRFDKSTAPSTTLPLESQRVGEVYNFCADCTTSEADADFRMREFIVIEKILGEEGRDKTYSFKAPRDSEVNIKFTKVARASDLLSTDASLSSVRSSALISDPTVQAGLISTSETYPVGGVSVNDPVRLAEIFKHERSADLLDKNITTEGGLSTYSEKTSQDLPSASTAAELRAQNLMQ